MQVSRKRIATGRYFQPFGLRCMCRPRVEEGEHIKIALVGVKAIATVTDVTCEVTLVQRYRNDEEGPLEVGYIFPLDSSAAVCRFEVELDGKRVVGKVMPNAEARDAYDDAIAEGSGAYLLEQKKEEVFQMNVGNLPPGKECTIHITYVAELPLEGEMVRFTLPTAIAPRYNGAGTTAQELDALKELSPTLPSSSSSSSSGQSVPYGLELDVSVEMPSRLLSVESPSHPIRFALDADSPTKGRVTLSTRETALDRDFVLLIQQKDAHSPGLWVDSERQAVMLTLYPKFAELEQKREFIFLLDRSGSMSGASIENAKSALQLFLRSLPEGCRFNIVGFGSTYQFLFKKSIDYSDASLGKASAAVARMNADLGGTEILEPIRVILDDHADPEYSRQVFVLTDGEVGNTEAILSLVREKTAMKMSDEVVRALERGVCTWNGARHYVEQHWYHCKTCYARDPLSGCCLVCKEVCHKDHDLVPKYGAFFCDCGSDRDRRCRALAPAEREPIPIPATVQFRVFTLGIGAAASRELVLGMAKAGRGTAEFVVPGERLESKVMRQLRLAMQPSVDDVTCEWGADWGPVLIQTPEAPPPLFDGTRLCIFGLVKENATLPQGAATEPVKVSYTSPSSADKQKESHQFLPADATVAATSVVRTLAAKHRIRELSEKDTGSRFGTDTKTEIEALGVKYQLATAHTSFVAKDEREEATQGTMQRRVVPTYTVSGSSRSFYSAPSPYVVHPARGGRGGLGGRGGRGGRGGGYGGGGFGYGGQGYQFNEMERGRCMGLDRDSRDRSRERERRRSRSRSRSPPPYSAPMAYPQQLHMSQPTNYVPGLGRGSLAFETSSNVGPLPKVSLEAENSRRKREENVVLIRQNKREESLAKKRKRTNHNVRGCPIEDEDEGEAENAEEEEEMDRELVVDKNSHEKLAKLVMLQRANGSFELNDKLAKLLGVPLDRLNALLSSLTTTDKEKTKQQVWATAMALAYLEIRLASITDDWAMMAEKSRRWLRSQTVGNSALAQVAWLDEAKKALTTKA